MSCGDTHQNGSDGDRVVAVQVYQGETTGQHIEWGSASVVMLLSFLGSQELGISRLKSEAPQVHASRGHVAGAVPPAPPGGRPGFEVTMRGAESL
jgi:hypothetical protein